MKLAKGHKAQSRRGVRKLRFIGIRLRQLLNSMAELISVPERSSDLPPSELSAYSASGSPNCAPLRMVPGGLARPRFLGFCLLNWLGDGGSIL